MRKLRTSILALSFLLLGGVVISAGCQEKERRPSRYLIPEGYVGWVRINFNVKDATPVPFEDGHYLFKFPASGLLETSSDIEYGVSSGDDYFYYSSEGKRQKLQGTGWGGGGMIWAGANGWSGKNFTERTDVHEVFFVGTEEELKKYGYEGAAGSQPKIGNVKKQNAPQN